MLTLFLAVLGIVGLTLCALYYFIESVRCGLAKKRWLIGGLILGPLIFPMFTMAKQIALRKTIGFNNLYFMA